MHENSVTLNCRFVLFFIVKIFCVMKIKLCVTSGIETEYFPARGISNSKFDIKCFNSLTGQAFEDFSFLYRLNSDHQPCLGFFVGNSSIRS